MIDMKEKAKDILEDYTYSYSQVDVETLAKTLCQIESEAIKEFAERLGNLTASYWLDNINIGHIDSLVAEMVGDLDER